MDFCGSKKPRPYCRDGSLNPQTEPDRDQVPSTETEALHFPFFVTALIRDGSLGLDLSLGKNRD